MASSVFAQAFPSAILCCSLSIGSLLRSGIYIDIFNRWCGRPSLSRNLRALVSFGYIDISVNQPEPRTQMFKCSRRTADTGTSFAVARVFIVCTYSHQLSTGLHPRQTNILVAVIPSSFILSSPWYNNHPRLHHHPLM